MMDRGQAHGSRAIQVAQDHTHPTFHLDGLSDHDGTYRAGGASKLKLFVHVVGTLASLAVIGLSGYWGYKQIMRDVHGVPVVRALEGPMRVAPEDPGGLVADHAGLAVNDVQAVGTASAPEDSLKLAPTPVGLTEDDQPAPLLQPVPEGGELGSTAEADDAELLPEEATAQMASLSEESPLKDPIARAIALANASTAGARPLSETELSGETERVEMASAPVLNGPGLARSPRPAPRPARLSKPAEAIPASASAAPAVMEASAVQPGTRLVQLGTFDTPDEARAAWNQIAARFDGMMVDKTQVIGAAKAGGQEFWRLRAMGFADLSEARRFCAALVAERADCIPVVAK